MHSRWTLNNFNDYCGLNCLPTKGINRPIGKEQICWGNTESFNRWLYVLTLEKSRGIN